MTYFASIESLEVQAKEIQAWVLDFPQAGVPARVSDAGLYVQGWLLTAAGVVGAQIVLRTGQADEEIVRPMAFNNDRPDVIQRVLRQEPVNHPQLRCGFSGYVAVLQGEFSVGVKLAEQTIWLCRVTMSGTPPVHAPATQSELQVIQGGDGWLYLDNDTNRSVDQFTGQLLLDGAGLERWTQYLDACARLAHEAGGRHALVVAASKEQVLPEFYPHSRALVTVHEQFLGLCRPGHNVVDTAALLTQQADKAACFIKTDTHWTDKGALAATIALVRTLGLDEQRAHACFAADVYYTTPFVGDLGTKLRPKAGAPTEFLKGPAAIDGAVFDNELPNIGRVLIFENPSAVWPNSLLLFGASSSYRMLKYMKRLFRRIVFIHSAGNVDVAIFEHERPDYLVMQTTARFMIEPPSTRFRLEDAVKQKMLAVDANTRARAADSAARAMLDSRNAPYCGMLEVS